MKHGIFHSGLFGSLAAHPPQALLIEGGNPETRLQHGKYWAQVVNCQSLNAGAACLECLSCRQIAEDVFPELIILGTEEKKMLIDEVREVRDKMGDSVRSGRTRVIILSEAQQLTKEAANALLKSVEEPGQDNIFVLTVPHRTALLPTLVSRSFVLTLPWVRTVELSEPVLEALSLLCRFAETGQELIRFTAEKGKVTTGFARSVLYGFLQMLAQCLRQNPEDASALFLSKNFSGSSLRRIERMVRAGLEYLENTGNPATALEWTGLQLWQMLQQEKTCEN